MKRQQGHNVIKQPGVLGWSLDLSCMWRGQGEIGEAAAACGLPPLSQTLGICSEDVSGLHPQKHSLVDREENFLTHLRDKAEEESGLKLG